MESDKNDVKATQSEENNTESDEKDAKNEEIPDDKPVNSSSDQTPNSNDVNQHDSTVTSNRELEIIRQVEYYFGDNNLLRDKFLLAQIAKDDDGWVPLSVLLTFKRLASLCTDTATVADCLMKSTGGIVEISEDKTKIRRHPERPIPEHNEERRKELMSRSLYIKGFPTTSDMSTLLEYFKPYDKVVNVYMRKYLDKPTKSYKFKGSVFVTFETKGQAEEFLGKKDISYNNVKLICKWQEKYLNDKREEHKAKNKKKEEKRKAEEQEKIEFPKGSVLYFDGVSGDVTREDIRESLGKHEEFDIAYIDFSKGDEKGNVRFTTKDSAGKFLENLGDSKLKVKDVEINLRTLTEDEEQIYFAKATEAMKNRRQHFQRKGKRRACNDRKEEMIARKKLKQKDDA